MTPWATPASALAVGAVLALLYQNPWATRGKRVAAVMLQVCVVLLGFGMDLAVVVRTGAQGAVFAAVTISATLLLGWGLGRLLGVHSGSSALISAGTAICGGSAIAAVGSVIEAEEAEISVSMGTVFIFNAAALYLFPPIGNLLHLSQSQFGTWAGVAIHDISSVVGAAASYGPQALQVATAVKLSRALWIIPVALGASLLFRGRQAGKIRIPWFIGLFLLASVARSFVPAVALLAPHLSLLATHGMTLTLFLIGAGLSAPALRQVGFRPLLQGLILWIFISLASLAVVWKTIA